MDPDTAPALDAAGGASGGNAPLPDGGFRALIQPALDPLFWPAERRGVPSAWWGHVPFAHWMVATAAPRAVVELGTTDGVSYSAFCRAADRAGAGAGARCFAVGAWRGEGEFEEFRAFHDARFAAFSTLLRCAPDEALGRFADGSIDLLHIVDGPRAYEAVRRGFEDWRPKLSDRGVVLLHGTGARDGEPGVRRLWGELRRERPGFEFPHGRGLGVLAAGGRAHPSVAGLCALEDPAGVAAARRCFAALGERCLFAAREATLAGDAARRAAEAAAGRAGADGAERRLRLETSMRLQAASRSAEARRDAAEARGRAERAEAAAHRAATDLHGQRAALLAQNASLQTALEERERLRAAEAGTRAAEEQRRAAQERETERFRAAWEAAEGEAERLRAALRETAAERDRILRSVAWRVTGPLRALAGRVPPGFRRAFRGGGRP